MTWRVCGSILISWWSGGYWAVSQNSPYCCVSALAPSPSFTLFEAPPSTPPPPMASHPFRGTPRFLLYCSMKNVKKKRGDSTEEINSPFREPGTLVNKVAQNRWRSMERVWWLYNSYPIAVLVPPSFLSRFRFPCSGGFYGEGRWFYDISNTR